MKSLLYAATLLLLAACSSAEPTPKNALLGRWQVVSSTETRYGANGQVLWRATSTYAPGSWTEFTDKEVLSYLGTVLDGRTVYGRQDSLLHIGYGTQPHAYQTIRQLDAQHLRLISGRNRNSAGEQADHTTRYQR